MKALGLLLILFLVPATHGQPVSRVGTITSERLNEASGIVASGRIDGVLWTHNDGSDGVLHAIRRDGSLIGSVALAVKIRDWEDIAADEKGNLYIADTGNNELDRKALAVHRLVEPDPNNLSASAKLAVERTWKPRFPHEPFNCESLFVRGEWGYVISKRTDGAAAELYRFSVESRAKTELARVATLPLKDPVTSAALSRDGAELAVLTRGTLYLFEINGDVSRVTDAPVQRIAIPSVQVEGCCFTPEGIVVVAESREIFLVAHESATTRATSRPATR